MLKKRLKKLIQKESSINFQSSKEVFKIKLYQHN